MNITYLLGAGASFHALPIVEKIPERLNAFASQFEMPDFDYIVESKSEGNIALRYLNEFNDINQKKVKYRNIQRFYSDIVWLKEESYKHSSIDTFAKKLFLKEGEGSNLKKLKYILSCFFLYEQTLNFDKRYDSFFASILESLSELPNNLRIISWNYDSQIEIAYGNFSNSSIDKTRQILNVKSKGNNINSDTSVDNFSVFKINGTTSVSHVTDGLYDIIPDFKNTQESFLIKNFLELYSSEILWRQHEPTMSFAWEKSKDDSRYVLELLNSIRNTDLLIVIGYSFPFFNRKTDKMILNSMKNLTKVYVQDPSNADDIIEKIKGFFPNVNYKSPGRMTRTIDFIPKTFVDQFFIPIEF